MCKIEKQDRERHIKKKILIEIGRKRESETKKMGVKETER